MRLVVNAEQSRACDAVLIEKYHIPGYTLMQNAARGMYDVMHDQISSDDRVLIVCGKGNNGGDGFVLSRYLKENGYNADSFSIGDPAALKGDAQQAYCDAVAAGCRILTELPDLSGYSVIVDALFGTGLSRDLTGEIAGLIEKMNAAQALKFAVDIPSGIDATTGKVLGMCFRADATVTFHYLKLGLVLTPGRAYAGKVFTVPIADIYPLESDVFLSEREDVKKLLPPRPLDSHKGRNGHALLIAGSKKYTGAALLASRSALRGGCGITSVAVPFSVKQSFCVNPDAIVISCGKRDSWDHEACRDAVKCLEKKTAVGVGPGMDRIADPQLLSEVLDRGIPTVLDADALNLMARERSLIEKLHHNVVITPHPGEMARLLSVDTGYVTADPVSVARDSAKKYGCTVLLKGATTCISDGERVICNITGNPGMAKGGSGDVLTGLILAMLSQGLKPFDAAYAGAYLFGSTADEAFRLLGNRMLTASDLVDAISADIPGELGC